MVNQRWAVVVFSLTLLLGCAKSSPSSDTFIFGMILVGPANDHGWSEAHYQAGRRIEAADSGTRMILVDNVNPGAKPGVTVPQIAEEMIAQGARLILVTSESLADGAREAALRHPDVAFLAAGSDLAWRDGRHFTAPPNLSTVMGRMEYGRMLSGFAAGMTTRTGRIGYVGPLINEETRRLAAATFLGARHAWCAVRGRAAKELSFKVVWIGFWFNLPGQTLDPSRVTDELIESGHDVILSGIDTVEALTEAAKYRQRGREVWAGPYDYEKACDLAPAAALGVCYFNWAPAYAKAIRLVREGRWTQYFDWNAPDWRDINSASSAVGFRKGSALAPGNAAALDTFVRQLGDGSLNLFRGPLRLQDGTLYLREGETASDTQIYYLPQLLEGMTGQSL